MKRNFIIKSLPTLIFFSFFFTISSLSQVKHPEWSYNLSIYEVNVRQFSEEGNFKSFAKHLPRLKEMGAGILWFMPLTPIGELNRKGSLGSYYSVKDYYDINPEFGTPEEFKRLVKMIHNEGMYVIVDWVANHTSWDNNLVKEHPEWFNRNDDGELIPPVADWADVIDLNYDNKELWAYMKEAMKYWVTEMDINGFRCDVAGMVPMEFWNEVRVELNKIKPVFILAEAEGPEFHEQAFDATYSWSFFKLMNRIAKGETNAAAVADYLLEEGEEYPASAFRMRFTSNHDENTWNGTEFERLGEAAGTFAVLSNIVWGIPLIYSGQEAGQPKRLQFFERDPIEWKEHPFKDIYTRLLHLKKENSALANGEQGGALSFPETGNDNIISILREKDEDRVMAVFNLSADSASVDINVRQINGSYSELFSGSDHQFADTLKVNLPPWGYKIFVKK